MRKHALLATVFAVLALLVSCSAVFDAGIGGKVYYMQNGSEVGISGAKILVYDNTSFSEAIGSARTDANGNFTVSKIVWKSSNPKYGKTADNHTVYIKVSHEDFEMTDEYITASLISDSTNSGMADVEMTKVRYTVPTFSGRITRDAADTTNPPVATLDGVPVYLVYKVGNSSSYERFSDDEAVVYTTWTQIGADISPLYIHGNFAGLGGGNMKYAVKDYPNVYVFVDKDRDGIIDESDHELSGPYPINGYSSYQIDGSVFDPAP